jgi:hypothetical protein
MFKKEDVYSVAKQVLENHVRDGGTQRDYCAFCYSEYWGGKVEHDSDCAVLISKDLLTGSGVEYTEDY